jgi:hypothetical protein
MSVPVEVPVALRQLRTVLLASRCTSSSGNRRAGDGVAPPRWLRALSPTPVRYRGAFDGAAVAWDT